MTKETNGEFFVDLNVMVVRKKDFKEDDVVDKIMSSLADQDGFQMVVSPLHQAIDRQTAELQKEVERLGKQLEFSRIIYRGEIEKLQDELLQLKKEHGIDPYWYWPQCDVEGCEGVSCNGGGCWRETGYWSVCSKHSNEFREGKPQPQMKQSAIDKEATRDKVTGYLPNTNNL